MTRLTPEKITTINRDILSEDNNHLAQLDDQAIGDQFFADFFRSPSICFAQNTSLLTFITQQSCDQLLKLLARSCHQDELTTEQLPILCDWDSKTLEQKEQCILTLIQSNSPLTGFYNPIDDPPNDILAITKIQFGLTQAWLNECIPASMTHIPCFESIIRFHTQYTSGIGFNLIIGEWISHLQLFLSQLNPTFSLSFRTDRQINIFIASDTLFYQSQGRLTLRNESDNPIDLGLITTTFSPTSEGLILTEASYENAQIAAILNSETPNNNYAAIYQFLHTAISRHLTENIGASLERQLQLIFLLYDYAKNHELNSDIEILQQQLTGAILSGKADFQEIAMTMDLNVPHADVIYARLKQYIEILHHQNRTLTTEERTTHVITLIARAIQHSLPIDLSNLNLCGIDFSGTSLKNAQLTNCQVDSNTNVSDCDLSNIRCDTLRISFPFNKIEITVKINEHGIKAPPLTLLYYAQKNPHSGPGEILKRAQLLALKDRFAQNPLLLAQLKTHMRTDKQLDGSDIFLRAAKRPFGGTSAAIFRALSTQPTTSPSFQQHGLFAPPTERQVTSIPPTQGSHYSL